MYFSFRGTHKLYTLQQGFNVKLGYLTRMDPQMTRNVGRNYHPLGRYILYIHIMYTQKQFQSMNWINQLFWRGCRGRGQKPQGACVAWAWHHHRRCKARARKPWRTGGNRKSRRSTSDVPHCKLFTPHCLLYTAHSTLYTTLQTLHFISTLHTPLFALHPLPYFTVYSAMVVNRGENLQDCSNKLFHVFTWLHSDWWAASVGSGSTGTPWQGGSSRPPGSRTPRLCGSNGKNPTGKPWGCPRDLMWKSCYDVCVDLSEILGESPPFLKLCFKFQGFGIETPIGEAYPAKADDDDDYLPDMGIHLGFFFCTRPLKQI